MAVEVIQEGLVLRTFQEKVNENFLCLNTSNAGTSDPTSATTGTLVYRTDLNQLKLIDETLDDTYTNSPNFFSFVRFQTIVISEADLTEASSGVSQTLNLVTLPANSSVLYSRVKTDTVFSGGSNTDTTVIVGDSSSATRYLTAYSLFVAVSDTNLDQNNSITPWDNAASFAVQATFTPTGDSLQNLTAGQVSITIGYVTVPT